MLTRKPSLGIDKRRVAYTCGIIRTPRVSDHPDGQAVQHLLPQYIHSMYGWCKSLPSPRPMSHRKQTRHDKNSSFDKRLCWPWIHEVQPAFCWIGRACHGLPVRSVKEKNSISSNGMRQRSSVRSRNVADDEGFNRKLTRLYSAHDRYLTLPSCTNTHVHDQPAASQSSSYR